VPPAAPGPSLPPKVKICCISSVAEARIAIEAGADALAIIDQHAQCRTNTLQPVDHAPHGKLDRRKTAEFFSALNIQ